MANKNASRRKKRALPPILKAWQVCRLEAGVTPFKKLTRRQRRRIESCVDKRMGR